MTEWERQNRARKERELSGRLRADLPSVPGFESLWQYFKEIGHVDEVLSSPEWYEDLLSEAKLIAEYQQHESKRTGYVGRAPGPQRGRPASPPAAAKLSEYEEEYAAALSAYYALAAGARPEVKRFREEVLSDGLLSDEEANGLLASPAAALLEHEEFERRGIPLSNHEAELLEEEFDRDRYRATVLASPPGTPVSVERIRRRRPALRPLYYVDEEGCTDQARVLRGSLLDKVRALSDSLAGRYGWEEAEATRFVLTGEPPFIPPLTGRPGGKYITLKAAPYVSADTVRRFYLQLQHEAKIGKTPQHTAQGARVLRFVLEQIIAGSKMPSWAELTRRWNKTHLNKYSSRDGLKRAYDRARKEIIEPHWTSGDYRHLPPIVTGLRAPGMLDANS